MTKQTEPTTPNGCVSVKLAQEIHDLGGFPNWTPSFGDLAYSEFDESEVITHPGTRNIEGHSYVELIVDGVRRRDTLLFLPRLHNLLAEIEAVTGEIPQCGRSGNSDKKYRCIVNTPADRLWWSVFDGTTCEEAAAKCLIACLEARREASDD